MPIQISWHPTIPNTLCYDFVRKWSWKEYFAAFELELTMVQTLDGETYHVIADFLQAPIVPSGPGITYIYHSMKQSPPNMGIALVVTRNKVIHNLVRLLGTIYPDAGKEIHFTDTLQEAEQKVRALHLGIFNMPPAPSVIPYIGEK